MHYRPLGNSGLDVSLLSFGTGGPKVFTESELDESGQDEMVRHCLDQGINLFDTSQGYGDSEASLGRALVGVPRDRYVLATKWGMYRLADDHSEVEIYADPEVLRRSVEESLRRLRTDHIDIMFFHGLRPEDYDVVHERFGPVMAALKEEGSIRCTALSERMGEDLEHEATIRALQQHPDFWDVTMLRYALFNQSAASRALPLCVEHGVGVLNMAPVRIILSDPDLMLREVAKWKAEGAIPDDGLPDGGLPDDAPLDWLVHDGVESVASAAMKFAADNPGISTVLTGTRNRAHLDANIRALEQPELPTADAERVRRVLGGLREFR